MWPCTTSAPMACAPGFSDTLCRYVARPAIALKRLSRDGDGLVVYELKHPFHDGTYPASTTLAAHK